MEFKTVFSHVEIPVQDYARAEQFYTKVFGWEIQQVPMGGPKYGLFPGGALMESAEVAKGGITPYVEVTDIPAVLEQVPAGGGSVAMPKTAIGGEYGFFAVVIDSEGNKIGVHSRT